MEKKFSLRHFWVFSSSCPQSRLTSEPQGPSVVLRSRGFHPSHHGICPPDTPEEDLFLVQVAHSVLCSPRPWRKAYEGSRSSYLGMGFSMKPSRSQLPGRTSQPSTSNSQGSACSRASSSEVKQSLSSQPGNAVHSLEGLRLWRPKVKASWFPLSALPQLSMEAMVLRGEGRGSYEGRKKSQ